MKILSNKEKIYDILKGNRLTIKDIAERTKFNENEVRVYIHRLKEKSLVKEVSKEGRWVIYSAIEQEKEFDNSKIIDTNILLKMIPKFIEYGIKLDTTTEKEDKRLMELINQCQ